MDVEEIYFSVTLVAGSIALWWNLWWTLRSFWNLCERTTHKICCVCVVCSLCCGLNARRWCKMVVREGQVIGFEEASFSETESLKVQ